MDWNTFFFSDVGKKIKGIIRGVFYTEVILTIIAGVILEIAAFLNLISGESEFFLVMLAIPLGVSVAIGVLWLSILLIYGFGEIVDTAIVNREKQLPVTTTMHKTIPNVMQRANFKKKSIIQDDDDDEFDNDDSLVCPICEWELTEEDGRFFCTECEKHFILKKVGIVKYLKEERNN